MWAPLSPALGMTQGLPDGTANAVLRAGEQATRSAPVLDRRGAAALPAGLGGATVLVAGALWWVHRRRLADR